MFVAINNDNNNNKKHEKKCIDIEVYELKYEK